VLAALTGAAAAVNMPARQAMGPQLAGPGLTSNAVALSSLSFNASRVLGPACAGLLIAVVGLFGCFVAQTVLLSVSAVLTGLIRTRGVPSPSGQPRSVGQNLVDGLEQSLRDPVLRGCIIVSLLHNLFGLTYSNLMPVFAGDVLGVGGAGLGTLMTAVGVGSAVGSIAAVMLSEHRQKGMIMFATSVAFGGGIVLFAAASWLPLALAALAFLGLVHAVASIANHTILNIASPDAYRGRVNSVFIFTWNIAPLGALPAGWLADQIGAPLTVGASGVLTIVTLAFAALWLTALRTFRDADYRPALSGAQATAG
jgi:predicted MFS family arabinose efflux permease